jgi:hypothetical protein
MTLHDLPFVKKWGSKNSFFQFFDFLRVLPGPYVMESRDDAYIMIEEVKSNHNICNKAGFTLWLCNLFRTKVSKKSKLSNSALT